MSTSQCAVYQVKETPEYRDVRFRSYEKLRSEGKSVSIENYQQVYIGRIKPGETPADIKTRLQKQRPKNFKGHSIGCSDVLVVTDAGETTAYYINKDGFIIVPEFLTIKSSSDTRLSIDTTGYEIEGKKGTWLAQDYILMNEKKWFLMEHEKYGTRAAYVILSEDGAVVMNDCSNNGSENPLQLLGRTAHFPFRIVPHFTALILSLLHGRTAIHFSTELKRISIYSTSSNFFKQAVLKVICPSDIVIAGFNLVEKNCARTISYPDKSNPPSFLPSFDSSIF